MASTPKELCDAFPSVGFRLDGGLHDSKLIRGLMIACLILPMTPLQVTKAVRVPMADPYAVSTITFPVALGGARHPSHAERLRDNILIQVCLIGFSLGYFSGERVAALQLRTHRQCSFVALQGWLMILT